MEVRINVPKTGLTDDGVKVIGEGLDTKECPTNYIDLSHNSKVTDLGVFYLARGLAKNTTVQVLKLNGTGLTDRGLDVIAKALETNSALRDLSIKGTSVTPAGLQSFSRSIQLHNRSLKTLETSPHLPACKGLTRCPGKKAPEANTGNGNSWTNFHF
eukprot:TRINITY_DN22874_c0_g1_i1.p1 TRINITY_DN22874_c0_g1~~TRINITY_DN22874_c0_g1_i1.p1  ORF type:complete len:164 (+),score=19.47 TRINITY_DN22874_c0_g1_i1:23-493(+)